MKFEKNPKYFTIALYSFGVIAAGMVFLMLLLNLPAIGRFLSKLIGILSPVLWGIAIAYLLTPVLRFFERRVFHGLSKKKPRPKLVRALSVSMTMLFLVALLAALIAVILPQIIDSIRIIFDNMDTYINNVKQWSDDLVANNEQLKLLVDKVLANFETSAQKISEQLMPFLNQVLGGVTSGVIGLVMGVKDFLIGLVISIYLLFSKETFFGQGKKVLCALFGENFTRRAVAVGHDANKVFGGFVSGKLLDSFIIGVLCYIGMVIFRMPYAVLISVIIGVFNVIPFFGPIIGAIPSALIIMLVDPIQMLWFILFVIVLQQFDGNILGPKILGDSTGLSAFWVITSILLFGGFMGVLGMFIGVPTFAVIYALVRAWIEKRLEKRQLPVSTADYKAKGMPKESGKP